MPYSNLDEIPKHTSLFVAMLGIFGAIINYHKRSKRSLIERISFFVTDMISSVMLSLTTFAVVISYSQNEILAIGASGYVAHQGTRLVFIIEQIIAKKFDIKL